MLVLLLLFHDELDNGNQILLRICYIHEWTNNWRVWSPHSLIILSQCLYIYIYAVMITCLNVLFNGFIDSPCGDRCTCMHARLPRTAWGSCGQKADLSLCRCSFSACYEGLCSQLEVTLWPINWLGVGMGFHGRRNMSANFLMSMWDISIMSMLVRSLELTSIDIGCMIAGSRATSCAICWHLHWMWLKGNMWLKIPLHLFP